VLGVAPDATAEEIKRRYRQLVKVAHPDAGRTGVELFLAVRRAYEVLSDPLRRAAYDVERSWRARAEEPPDRVAKATEAAGPTRERWQWTGETLENFARSFFGNIWADEAAEPPHPQAEPDWLLSGISRPGQRQAEDAADARQSRRGAPRVHLVELTLAESFAGKDAEVDGVRVRIPPGARDQSRYRISTPPAEIVVRLQPHRQYRVQGDDLAMDLAVAHDMATRGGELRLTHPGGPVVVRLPAGVRPGQILRLRGQGLPATPARRAGDLLLRVEVVAARPEAAAAQRGH
jgi:curved DNA-binding protein